MSIEAKENNPVQFSRKAAETQKALLSGMKTLPARIIPLLTLLTASAVVLIGSLSIGLLTLEDYPVPLLGILCILMQILFIDIFRQKGVWDFNPLILAGAAFTALLILPKINVLWTGWQINALIDHSLFSAAFLLLIGTPAMMVSLYYFLGATPSAEDISHYPLILLPVVLVLSVYGFLLGQLWVKGSANFDPFWILKPYLNLYTPVMNYIAGDWPIWSTVRTYQVGLLNHLLGTGLLMLLTSLFSLPIGVGAGIYLNEYGDNWFGRTARFLISSLRAISLLVLGLTALSIAFYTSDSALAWITHGNYFDGWQVSISPGGSYFTASLVLSLLVVPIIAAAAEQGCHSLPTELREGSLALGASEETTLRRVVLPWALPNIVTSVILGCAEAAGSVAVLLFIAGRGVYGVGVFKQVTSLAFFIFDVYYGGRGFQSDMGGLQFTAGLILLLITLCLGILSMIIKRWLVRRNRGG